MLGFRRLGSGEGKVADHELGKISSTTPLRFCGLAIRRQERQRLLGLEGLRFVGTSLPQDLLQPPNLTAPPIIIGSLGMERGLL